MSWRIQYKAKKANGTITYHATEKAARRAAGVAGTYQPCELLTAATVAERLGKPYRETLDLIAACHIQPATYGTSEGRTHRYALYETSAIAEIERRTPLLP